MNKNRNRRELREAHKIHKKVLLPYLTRAAIALEIKSPETRKQAMYALDTKWREYCTQYDKMNSYAFPNHEAFKTSIENHKKKLELN